MYEYILIRYGEIALKGKNQKDFLKQLVKNIKRSIRDDLGIDAKLSIERGRVFLNLFGKEPELFYPALIRVFGISSFSPVRKVKLDLEIIKDIALEEFKSLPQPESFRVSVNRPNKRFAIKSPDLQKIIGAYLYSSFEGLRVDLHCPEVEVSIEIRDDGAYIFSQKFSGLGGLPVGAGGKAMLLISGGIDSPVAGWLTIKKGVVLETIYFHSHPYTSERAKEKVIDLIRVLANYTGRINIHIVPFNKIQEEISQNCYESLWITLMRRFMFRIAEKIAENRKAMALVTGESLGQVASQTIESMNVINETIKMPVIRPLITMDKAEIMEISRKIKTYDISIRPYEDCCTVFLPREPKTKPKLEACLRAEARLDIDKLVNEALENIEIVAINRNKKNEFDHLF